PEDRQHERRDDEERDPGDREHDRDRDGREEREHERVRAVAGEVLAHGSVEAPERAQGEAEGERRLPGRAVAGEEADADADDADEHAQLDQRERVPGRLRALTLWLGGAPRRPRGDLRGGALRAAAALAPVLRHGQPDETLTRHHLASKRGRTSYVVQP